MQQTPASLLERLRRPGEQAAWDRFVKPYTPLLFHWARRLGLQQSDAADLVQEVLTALIRELPKWSKFSTCSCRAGWKPAPHSSPRCCRRPHATEAVDEAEYQRYLVGRSLRLMQTEFQPTTWMACWKCVVEGRTTAEVAAELGMSAGAVHVAKSRVLRRLREELEGLLG